MSKSKLLLTYFIYSFSLIIIITNFAYSDSGADFLNMEINPRAIALGGAYSAVCDESSSLHWNPSRLNEIQNVDFHFMHANWFFDTYLEYASFAKKSKLGSFGLSFYYFGMAGIPIAGELGEELGRAVIYDMAFTVGYANKFLGVPLGINLKYIRRRLDNVTANAVAFDLGIYYNLNFLKLYKSPLPNFSIAFVARNIGTKIQFKTLKESLPLTFSLGIKYIFLSMKKHNLFFASDVTYEIKEIAIPRIGLEYNLFKIISVRAGYKYEYRIHQFTVGAGFSYDFSFANLNINLAYVRYSKENAFPVSISIKSPLDKIQKTSVMKYGKTEPVNDKPDDNEIKVGFGIFKNLSKKKDLDYLSMTIPESVNAILSKNTNITVLETYKINNKIEKLHMEKDNEFNYMKLYEELNVLHLVIGSFIEIDGKIKVNLKIIDTRNNKVLMGKSINGDSGKNVFSLIDNVAKELENYYKNFNN